MTDIIVEGVTRANAFWVSIVRTLAPKVAAIIVTFLLSIGIDLSDGDVVTLGVIVVAIFEALWYVVARLLEVYVPWPWAKKLGGYMLGIPKKPVYGPKTIVAGPNPVE